MPKPRRIIFSGDFLRPQPAGFSPAQFENIHWLSLLLRTPVQMATGLPCQSVYWDHRWETGTVLDSAAIHAIYAAFGYQPDITAWARIYATLELPAAVEEMLIPLFADSVVIGFELPPWLTAFLERQGLPFIDCAIAPVRFLDDLLFRLSASDPDITEALAAHRMDEAIITLSAGVVSGHIARDFAQPPHPDSLLLVLQTPFDKVVIENGRFTRLTDHLDQLLAVAEGYREILIRAHPLDPQPALSATLHGLLPQSRLTKENVYRLMAHPNVTGVAALSSSCVEEAAYFGKAQHYLIPGFSPDRMTAGAKAILVDDILLAPDFWRDLLSAAGCAVSPHDGVRLAPKPNRIRQQLRNAWGYNQIDTDIFVQWATV